MPAMSRSADDPRTAPSRVVIALVLLVVAAFVILEYVYDWPIHIPR